MGQATLDLPDPTQLSGNAGPLSPQALASADDLLSQLAGDDIDRLLAEAESERQQASPPTPSEPWAPVEAPAPPALAAPADIAASTEAAIDAILGPAIESTLKAVDDEIAAAAPAIETLPLPVEAPTPIETPLAVEAPASAQSALEVAPADPTVLQLDAPAPAVSTATDQKLLDEAAAHVSAIMDPAPEPIPATVADAAERQALSDPLIVPQTAKAPSIPVRCLVKILEWINAPMRFISDDLRQAMGKVAIMTTCNAAAVIVYVMVFRRPHH